MMLCCIIGGALDGVGMAMTFANGGSTGGTDIVALIINKYRSISGQDYSGNGYNHHCLFHACAY